MGFICPTKVGRIMVLRVSSVRPCVNIWLCTGVTTCRISFNFSIIHLVCPIHDTGNGPWSSSNMRILTQLLIFAFWSLLKPFLPRSPEGLLSSPERAGGWASGQTSPVNTLTSTIFHGSFSNLARTFIALRSRTSLIMEVLPH